MQIAVTGKQIKVGAALQEYVERELESYVSRYFDNAVGANVVFSKSRHLFRTDIIVNEGTGTHVLIKSHAEGDDVYKSFDKAGEKVEKQLRRYKRRLKNHHKNVVSKEEAADLEATKYVLAVQEDEAEAGDAPLIIAEKATKVENLTVNEAVMTMDLLDLPALMFVNRKTGAVSVVYRREDGNISWVDSEVRKSVVSD